MRFGRLIFILFIAFLVSGCASNIPKRQDASLRKGIYATADAMAAGRFDVAKQYNDQLTRLVPPPEKKERVKINAFSASISPTKTNKDKAESSVTSNLDSKRFVVLPEEFAGQQTITVNSKEYQDLVSQNKELRDKEVENIKNLGTYKETTDKLLLDKEKEYQKLLQEKNNRKGFFGKVWGIFKWIIGLGSLGIIIGLIVISVFFPAAWPVVISIFSVIKRVLNGILYGLGNFIGRFRK